MSDMATLGIQVVSSGADKAAADLTKLSGAAARAEMAVDGLEAASQGATGAANAAAAAYSKQGAAAQSASKQIGTLGVAANQNTKGMIGATGNVANIAAQFQDIGVSAAMSMNPLQIALQQGTQLAAVIGAMENPVKGLAAAFGSILSPVSLATIGIVAAAAALLQMVNWAKLGAAVLNGLASALEAVAPYAVVAAAAIALLYAPAIIGGIVSLIAMLGRLAVSALGVAAAFAAANPAVAFILGLTLAVAAANIFRDELKNIFGRDIVADVKNATNFIIGAFVGAFNGIKAAWGLLPAAIGDIVYQTVNLTISGVQSMINKVISMINSFIGGVYDRLGALGQYVGVDIGKYQGIGDVNLGQVSNPYAGAVNNATTAVSSAMKDAQGKDYVAKVTDVIAAGADNASKKLRELASSLLKVDEKKKKSSGKTDTEKYSDIVDGANRSIASLRAEYQAVGLTAEAASKLKHETELLNQAQQKGIILTAAQKTELSGLAATMASIETATANAKASLEFAKSSATGFLSTLRQGLIAGEGLWKSFGNAALGVLDKIASKMEETLVNSLFDPGGLLAGLFGSAFKPTTTLGGFIGASGAPALSGAISSGGGLMRPAGLKMRPNTMVSGGASANGNITIHLVNDGLNIYQDVSDVAAAEARKMGVAVEKSTRAYTKGQMHNDINAHLKNPRRKG